MQQPGPDPRIIAIQRIKASLREVTCPHCGRLLAKASPGATVEVKCLKCKVWVIKTAA